MLTTLAQFNETQVDDAFALQNPQLLKVRLGVKGVRTCVGNAVAWEGNVDFGGVAEDGLRGIDGTGEVFLADASKNVHLVLLENEAISATGRHLLAFEAGVDHDAIDVGEPAFDLRGTGWVALVSHGTPVLLNAGAAPTWCAREAAVAWSHEIDVEPSEYTLGFSGEGWVLVQPAS